MKKLQELIRGNSTPIYLVFRKDNYAIVTENFRKCYFIHLKTNEVFHTVKYSMECESLYNLTLKSLDNPDIKKEIYNNYLFKQFSNFYKEQTNNEIVL